MSDNDTTRRRFIQVAGGATAVALAGCSSSGDGGDSSGGGDGDSMDDSEMDDDGEPTTFIVRVENVGPTDFYASDSATGGQVWITPGAYGVHTGPNPIFTEGEAASPGRERDRLVRERVPGGRRGHRTSRPLGRWHGAQPTARVR